MTLGGSWDGTKCTFPSVKDPAKLCTEKGGVWNNGKCTLQKPTPRPAPGSSSKPSAPGGASRKQVSFVPADNSGTQTSGARSFVPQGSSGPNGLKGLCSILGGKWDGKKCTFTTSISMKLCKDVGGVWNGITCLLTTDIPTKNLCTTAGGTWDNRTSTCTLDMGSEPSAICVAGGGVWNSGKSTCNLGK